MAGLTAEKWEEHRVEEGGERLDVYLVKNFPELTRARAQKLIEDGNVRVNESSAKSNYKTKPGDTVAVFLPSPKPVDLIPENIPLTVYYEDDELVVLEKPAGMVVHPAEGNWTGTLVHALLYRYQGNLAKGSIGGELRPGIVHRIDKNTSGTLVIARTDRAHLALSEQFQKHTITRRYTGIAWGKIPPSGDWSEPIARDPRDRQRMAVVEGGRNARTQFEKKQDLLGPASLFQAELFTGRTHQIRVHFSHYGFPLVGDTTYTQSHRSGRVKKEAGMRALEKTAPEIGGLIRGLGGANRQFLHASHLSFTHPVSGTRLAFESPLPPDLSEILIKWQKLT